MDGDDFAAGLAGVYRVTLPVRDVARSAAWYESRLGYRQQMELIDADRLTAMHLRHPDSGPLLVLRWDPERAAAVRGFDSFTIAVADQRAIEDLARHLSALGEPHGGTHPTPSGWVLALVHDPDGRELRFATTHASDGAGEASEPRRELTGS